MRKPSTAFLAGIAILLLQGRASGQASPSKTAEALFREARQLMDAKDYTGACPKFAESQKLEPAPGTLLNLADCYEKSGLTASAWSSFKEASRAATARNRADWAATANMRAAALEPKLATVSISVASSSEAPGLRIERDGVVVERSFWGMTVAVDPGPHVLAATATGRKPWTKKVEVLPAKNIVVEVPSLEPEPVVAPPIIVKKPVEPEEKKPEPESSPLPVVGYVVTGVGVVGLVIGTVTGLSALSKRSDAERKCESYPGRCSPEGNALNDDAKQSATISTVSLIAGGVLVAGGIVLILIAPKKADTHAALPFVLGGTF